MKHLRFPSIVMFVLAAAACGGSSTSETKTAAAAGKPVDAATAGSVSGTARFDGPAPAPEVVRVSTDKNCVENAGPNPQSDSILVGADGALKNAFVYVKDGLDPGYSFETPTTPVLLDQKGCFYSPRVVGLRVGQPIEIVNSDATMHNVHALPVANTEFNRSQMVKGAKNTEVFTTPEVMVRFMCNVHNWMAAYVGVLPHPYFAVTDAEGRFEIRNLPPGTYTLEAWHEKFGRQTATVTVAAKQAQAAAFTFTLKPETTK
jgi:plastocyanin